MKKIMLKNFIAINFLIVATTLFSYESWSSQFDNINDTVSNSEDEKAPDFTLLTLGGSRSYFNSKRV
jgi:hypothetical protein